MPFSTPIIGRSTLEPSASKRKMRILVIDDSVVMRQLITRMLADVPGLEVIGTARDGLDGLAKIQQLSPDLVTLDVEMPRLDGIGTLREIKRLSPNVRVVMCSSLTERGAAVTLDALLAGADDYVTKQHSGEMAGHAYEELRADLLLKIQHINKPRAATMPLHRLAPAVTPPVVGPARSQRRSSRAEVVVIGVSTGGPAALAEIVPLFPADFPVPVAIVQHMPPVFTQLLAERLSKLSYVPVLEAKHGMPLRAGQMLLAPGNFHMRIAQIPGQASVVHLNQDAPENSCRPAVDVLFRSAAEAFGPAVIAVVLTGMGQDGLLGARELKRQRASVIAQDEASSVVWGMPRAVAEAGLADVISPLRDIVPAILRLL